MSPLTFTARAQDLRIRADVGFAAGARDVSGFLTRSRYEAKSVASIAQSVQYGLSLSAHTEPEGYPILRMNNLQDDGWDLRDLKYVKLNPTELNTYALRKGDILINRTNGSRELVGKCEVFREDGDWVFASYLIRLRVDPDMAHPEYVAAFLNSAAGRAQVLRASRQILMSNINSTEIKDLQIPLPPLERQRQLAARMEVAREARGSRRAEASALAAEVEPTLQEQLSIRVPGVSTNVGWTARLAEISQTKRLDPGAFHPERVAAIEALRASGHRILELGDLATPVRTLTSVPPATLGMADVESGTGALIGAPSQQVATGVEFNPGDVLFAKLRPRLNKVYFASHDGYCSPEFIVLRPNTSVVLGEYLAHVLRFSTTVMQAVHLATGNTLPRVSGDDAMRLLVPVPSLDEQAAVVELANHLSEAAQAAKREGDRMWAESKAMLLEELFDQDGVDRE